MHKAIAIWCHFLFELLFLKGMDKATKFLMLNPQTIVAKVVVKEIGHQARILDAKQKIVKAQKELQKVGKAVEQVLTTCAIDITGLNADGIIMELESVKHVPQVAEVRNLFFDAKDNLLQAYEDLQEVSTRRHGMRFQDASELVKENSLCMDIQKIIESCSVPQSEISTGETEGTHKTAHDGRNDESGDGRSICDAEESKWKLEQKLKRQGGRFPVVQIPTKRLGVCLPPIAKFSKKRGPSS